MLLNLPGLKCNRAALVSWVQLQVHGLLLSYVISLVLESSVGEGLTKIIFKTKTGAQDSQGKGIRCSEVYFLIK